MLSHMIHMTIDLIDFVLHHWMDMFANGLLNYRTRNVGMLSDIVELCNCDDI